MSYDEGRPDAAPTRMMAAGPTFNQRREPVRDEEYFERGHSSPHNPPNSDIPDSADLDQKREGVELAQPEQSETIPDSASGFVKPIFTPEEWKEIMQEVEIVKVREGDKYIIMLDKNLEEDVMYRVGQQLEGFWQDPEQRFMLMGSGFQLVKVDPNAQLPTLASCGHPTCPGHEPGSDEECDVELKVVLK